MNNGIQVGELVFNLTVDHGMHHRQSDLAFETQEAGLPVTELIYSNCKWLGVVPMFCAYAPSRTTTRHQVLCTVDMAVLHAVPMLLRNAFAELGNSLFRRTLARAYMDGCVDPAMIARIPITDGLIQTVDWDALNRLFPHKFKSPIGA